MSKPKCPAESQWVGSPQLGCEQPNIQLDEQPAQSVNLNPEFCGNGNNHVPSSLVTTLFTSAAYAFDGCISKINKNVIKLIIINCFNNFFIYMWFQTKQYCSHNFLSLFFTSSIYTFLS